MSQIIRKPAVSGQFYDSSEEKLKKSINNCFLDPRGPGKLSSIQNNKPYVKGLIVPHAGYIYSGAIAAHSYDYLLKHGFADTFIIIGPNHTGMGSGVSVMKKGKWATPLGQISIDETISKDIHTGIIDADESAHLYEHSIEVQLPFLQFIAKEKKFKFVPICMAMQDYQTSKEIGEILIDTIKKTDKKIVIIASSDFSHAGFNYQSMPPSGTRVDKFAEMQDKKAIDQILNMNAEGLIDTVQKNNITMCGFGPIAAMITACNKLEYEKVKLLKYATSYEVHPSSSCVGYGALVIS